MKDFKESLEFRTRKNIDEQICYEVEETMKKMCVNLEEQKCKENEENINKNTNQIKDRTRKIKWIFVNFDKCMEFIEPKSVFGNIQIQKKTENEIDKEILLSTEEGLKKLYINASNEEERQQVLNRMKGLKNLMKNFDENILKIQRMEMQQTKLGYLALANVR